MRKLAELEPAGCVKACVVIVYVVNTYECRLGLVCIVAVPCISFFVAVVAVARTVVLFCSFPRNIVVKWYFWFVPHEGRVPVSTRCLC